MISRISKALVTRFKQFHVKYPDRLIPYLEDLQKKGVGKLLVKTLYKRYSLIAEFVKN